MVRAHCAVSHDPETGFDGKNPRTFDSDIHVLKKSISHLRLQFVVYLLSDWEVTGTRLQFSVNMIIQIKLWLII